MSAAGIFFRVSKSLEDAFGTFLLGIMLGEQCKIYKSTTGYNTIYGFIYRVLYCALNIFIFYKKIIHISFLCIYVI